MKIKLVLLIVVLVMVVLWAAPLPGHAQEGNVVDRYGKIVIQILDPESEKPVEEVFNLVFLDMDSPNMKRPIRYEEKTDDKGYFSAEIHEGDYYLESYHDGGMRYSVEPTSYYVKKDYNNYFSITRGKLTKIWKKASIGGNLEVILVEPNGQKLDVENLLGESKFSVTIKHTWSYYALVGESERNFSPERCSFLFRNIPNGEYKIQFGTPANIEGNEFKGIKVEKGKTTEYRYVVDVETGIEGIVVNSDGVPMKSVEIELRGKNGATDYASDYTNEAGYFKILGLKKGLYKWNYALYDKDTEKFYGEKMGTIQISSGNILVKNITFKRTLLE